MNVGMGGEHMKRERSDLLKRRPNIIRYYFCVVSEDNSIHTGTTYSALLRAHKKSPIRLMLISDIASGIVIKAGEPVEHFLLRWRYHYNDHEWDYQRDIDEGQPLPKEGN